MISGTIADKDYGLIRKLVYDWSRINLGPNKKELVRNRLHKRLKDLGLKSFEAYCRVLHEEEEGGEEMTALLDAISTNVTCFFRDLKHFEFLEQTILPEWENHPRSKPGETLRIWSAACSSGEEAYSLAIVLAEFFGERPDWKIFATDISHRMLEAGREAVYKSERIKAPNPAWLRKYFQKGVGEWDGYYRVKSSLRQRVEFSHLNLIEWPYRCAEKFDVIFCRNVMIYFDGATREQLMPRLIERLKPGGFLFVGHSEKLLKGGHGLKCVRPSIYQHL